VLAAACFGSSWQAHARARRTPRQQQCLEAD